MIFIYSIIIISKLYSWPTQYRHCLFRYLIDYNVMIIQSCSKNSVRYLLLVVVAIGLVVVVVVVVVG